MKLKDIKITAKLRIGFGIILLFVAGLGVMAWYQVENVWRGTEELYFHPLTVRKTVDLLNNDIFSLLRDSRDFIYATSAADGAAILQTKSRDDADVILQLNLLYKSYLGPRKDLDAIAAIYARWNASTDTILQLARGGMKSEAIERTRQPGYYRSLMDTVFISIGRVSDFAFAKSNQIFHDARKTKTGMQRDVWTLFGIILLLSAVISLILIKEIRTPLKDLTSAAKQFQHGNLGVRSSFASRNEFGALAESFNGLAETIQLEMENREKVLTTADAMLREDELRSFSRELLALFLEHTQSHIAAVYILNERKTEFELYESIGLSADARKTFSVETKQGEFGVALSRGQISRICDVPGDSQFTFTAVSGDIRPREILTIPIVIGTETIAMLSLASLREYSPHALRFVNDVQSMLTARLSGVLAHKKIIEFSSRMDLQNRELHEKTKELAIQGDELSEQNIELEMQKKQLDEANRLKSVFLSNMSHELRTPLNSVIALAGVLNRRLLNAIPEEEYGYLSIIERNGKQLLTLINDILDLSRIEAGREEIHLSIFSPRKLVDEIVAMCSVEAEQKNIELRNDIPEDLPPIKSDMSRCRHILQNLIGNAVKFTSEGSVCISMKLVDHTARIAVADTGIGISPQTLPHIFDEFRQADESVSRKFGGTGLGLAIAKKYAVLLRGTIVVESSPGKGSTFILILPLSQVDDKDQPADNAMFSKLDIMNGESSFPSGDGKNILLVEDSEAAQIQMADALAEDGYILHVTQNGREALEHVARAIPDAIILDLMMPEMDGFELLSLLRKEQRTALIPVLILTAKHISDEDLRFLKGNNIHQLIQKGDISRDKLLAAVANMFLPKPPRHSSSMKARRRVSRIEKPVILVIEDNRDNMETMKALLRESAVVVGASDGPSGLASARRHVPDLIFSDISLPGKDGFAVLEEIRNDERLRHIPVVAITARAMKGDREEFLASGFDGYVPKPIDDELLKKTIEEILYGG